MPSPDPNPESQADLGLGRVLAQESTGRFIDKDGRFLSRRLGLDLWRSVSLYHELLTMPWWVFFLLVTLGYALLNVAFALGYLALGPGALEAPSGHVPGPGFWRSFFFSIETFATIGYGHIAPVTFGANVLVSLESLVGLLGVALATGLLFARFSLPSSRILFSRSAVIAPYAGGAALMFRIVNGRRNQLIEVEAEVTLSRFESVGGVRVRRFYPLVLARPRVTFFPLAWTVVHPIDGDSPLQGITAEQLQASDAEFIVLIRAVDDALFHVVRTRSSYKAGELVWNAKFGDMYRHDLQGVVAIDVNKLNLIERLGQDA